MESSRSSIIVLYTWAVLCGKTGSLEVHGPFDTEQEALDYCDKSLPDRTIEITPMRKEVITHGER